MSPEETRGLASAVLGGGCFWCLEAVFARLPGVSMVENGYAGGTQPAPSYEEVCRGTTGHAEVVRVHYDPEVIAYRSLLDWFWRAHDPTTYHRQGADVGPQYRSILLYADDEQRREAVASRERAAERFADPIVTEIEPLGEFYPAEADHQRYYERHTRAPYCAYVIAPKLRHLGLDGSP